MKVVQCPNKHYYDSELFPVCPHCQSMGLLDSPAAPPAAPQTGRKDFNQDAAFVPPRPEPPITPPVMPGAGTPAYPNSMNTPAAPPFGAPVNSGYPQQNVPFAPPQDRTDGPGTTVPGSDRTGSPRTTVPGSGQTEGPNTVMPESPKTSMPSGSNTVMPDSPKTTMPDDSKTVMPDSPKTTMPDDSKTMMPDSDKTVCPPMMENDKTICPPMMDDIQSDKTICPPMMDDPQSEHTVAPQTAVPQTVMPQMFAQQTVMPQMAAPQTVTPQNEKTILPKFMAPKGKGKRKNKKTEAILAAAEQMLPPVQPAPEQVPAPPVQEPAGITTLQKEISATNATSIRTDSKTIGFFNVQEDVEPVVGWLVGISGEYLGVSFELRSGRNNIGRDADMDVSLAKEPTVSRNKHAVVIFDPIHSKFVLQAGEEKGLIYLNGELVVTYETMKDRDVIELGKAKLMLIALCNDSFTWETYIK